jgi:hypothetical protein
MGRKVGDKMKNIIEIKNLCKQFDKFVAVNNISFTVKQGELFPWNERRRKVHNNQYDLYIAPENFRQHNCRRF